MSDFTATVILSLFFFLSVDLAGLGLFTANHTSSNLTLNDADSVYVSFFFSAAIDFNSFFLVMLILKASNWDWY